MVAPCAYASDPIAERLYRDGRAAAQVKDWDRACALFQQSQNREPAPGTLLNLADCEEHRGKLVTATAQYNAAARLFQSGDERTTYAKQRASTLEKRIAKLRIRAEGNATIECDGVVVDPSSLGTVVTMDPGEHVFVVKAEGRAEARSVIRLGEGESREIELKLGPILPATPASDPSVSDPPTVAETAPAPPPAVGTPDVKATVNRTPAYIAFGVGAVGVGVGAVTGLLALDSAHTVKTTCPNHICASQAHADAAGTAASDTRTWATISAVGFGVGVGAAAAGLYLLLRKPSNYAIGPDVGRGTAGVLVRGTF